MFTAEEELKIGQVVEVSGTNIKIEISDKISELSRTFNGRVYPIGQIGSMVKIHYGRKIIFGLVIGSMAAAPLSIYMSRKISNKWGLLMVGGVVILLSLRTLLMVFM